MGVPERENSRKLIFRNGLKHPKSVERNGHSDLWDSKNPRKKLTENVYTDTSQSHCLKSMKNREFWNQPEKSYS